MMTWATGINAQIDILSSLGPLLSPDANVHFPNTTAFNELTASFVAKQPSFAAVVEVGTASDVEHTVCVLFLS